MLVFCGDLPAAAATVAETESVQEATGIRSAPYGALILEAWWGRPLETRALIETTNREAGARGEGIGLAISAYARAVLATADGLRTFAVDSGRQRNRRGTDALLGTAVAP